MLDADLDLLAEIIGEYEGAAHGQKQRVLQDRLALLGISEGTFFRWRWRWGRRDYDRKTPATRGQVREPERLSWTREIWRLKHSKIKGVRALTTQDAVRLAVQWGRVPPEAGEVPEGTYNRLARVHLKLSAAPRRGVRWEAPYANHLHQVDASGSEYLYPHRPDGDDWILKFRPRPMKNKPTSEGRQRLWYWGLADDFSGCRIARALVAPGESALDGINFLKFCWSTDPAHVPLRGVPLILYIDNGSLAKHHAVQRFLGDCAVNLTTHEPERAQATGKVETGWKDFWRRFEALFLRLPDWRTREFSLKELNQELHWFVRGSNQRGHRHLPGSKEEAWLASARERGGVTDIDPSAWDTVFRDFRRVLDDAGVFDLHGQAYVVKEIHACPVLVFQGMMKDRVVVEDRRDGKRYEARPWEIPAAGAWRATAHTPLENLLKDDPWRDQRPAPPTWAPGTQLGADLPENVLVLPVRQAEVRESAFEMPESQAGKPVPLSLEELAAGVEVVAPRPEAPRLFATPLERYEFLLVKEARGEELTGEEKEFMAWFRAEYREMLALAGQEIDRRVRLAVVE